MKFDQKLWLFCKVVNKIMNERNEIAEEKRQDKKLFQQPIGNSAKATAWL